MDDDRREVGRPPQPAALTTQHAEDPHETIQRALRFLYLLPAPTLTRREQNKLVALLVDEPSRLVHAVARALATYAAELPEVDEDPADLLTQQERADQLMTLRGHLDALSRRAEEAYLRTQGQAVRRAHAVLQRLDQGAQFLPPGSYEQRLRRSIIARGARFDERFTLSTLPEDL